MRMMRCPYCGNGDETQVKDSRPERGRGRHPPPALLPDCGGRFTTFERVQLRELVVLKKSGKRVPFDRDKLMRSVQIALRKRPGRAGARRAHGLRHRAPAGEPRRERDRRRKRSASSSWRALRGLDDVAYVRFASVYKNFREAKDFEDLLGELSGEEDERRARG
jgi:transcriptional repressor NrdR